jgi:hypothetical protein
MHLQSWPLPTRKRSRPESERRLPDQGSHDDMTRHRPGDRRPWEGSIMPGFPTSRTHGYARHSSSGDALADDSIPAVKDTVSRDSPRRYRIGLCRRRVSPARSTGAAGDHRGEARTGFPGRASSSSSPSRTTKRPADDHVGHARRRARGGDVGRLVGHTRLVEHDEIGVCAALAPTLAAHRRGRALDYLCREQASASRSWSSYDPSSTDAGPPPLWSPTTTA